MRSFHMPGRSPVYAQRAMCATSHPLASATAIDILRHGGNAVDAAIAAAAVLAVVEHPMTGIGGDCFAIIARPGQKLIGLNASGRAPAAATAGWYAGRGVREIEMHSPHAVTVPGAIDGWTTLLADHGTLPLARLLAPAIDYAERGFPVAPRVAHDWANVAGKLELHAGARRHLLPQGRAPQVGEVVRFPALARTLKLIADEGRDGFYQGEVADDIVAELKEMGGLHTLADFAAQRCSYVEPISVAYRGVELHELPPNNQGIVALILLKILERTGLGSGKLTSAERYHMMMEAGRLAYAMRDAFVADPQMASVPVEHMLSDAAIGELARRIDPKRRTPDLGPVPQPAGSDTIYLSIVDEKGMAVSFINSLYSAFGSGIVTRKTGVTLHNRGQGFVLDPGHPNCIAPRKRPMHTLVPAMATRGGEPFLSFGVMGAAFQPMGHAYVLTNMLDFGMDPQEAIDCPRVFFEGGELFVEESVPASTAERLAGMGHAVKVRDEPWGGGQAICIDSVNGVLIGASDPRKDGCALGY
ncbi:MAG: gamma-glutamyltransferase [Hyphomicrobiaceae bacterium]|nr:gamma-glutamyltransferase [Hyphomicrobiaceae bacterium]